MTQRLLARLLLLSGAITVVGSLLPWHTVSGLGTELNIDGIDSPNNGVVTLVLGVLVAALGWRMVDRDSRPRRSALALAVVSAGAGVWALIDAGNAEDDLVGGDRSRELLRAAIDLDRAYGQWVLLAGVLLSVAVGLVLARPSGAGPPPSSEGDGGLS